MKIQCLILDVDGTIVANSRIIVDLFKETVKQYLDREMTDSEVLSLWGPPGDEIFRNTFPESLVNTAWNTFLGKYKDQHPKQGFFTREQLQDLKKHVRYLTIFTGKSRTTYDISIKKLGFSGLFDLIKTGSDVERSKPYPDALFQIISTLNLNKEEVLFLGDSHLDVIAGKSAGICTAGALWGTMEKEKLEESNPEFKFETPLEFIEFVKKQD